MPAPYSGEPAFSFLEAVDLPVRFIRRVIMGVIMRRAPMEAQDSLSGTPGRIVGTGDSLCVKYGDQFLPLAQECRVSVAPGDEVLICEVKSGYAWVKPREK